jgi:hypothetical protein
MVTAVRDRERLAATDAKPPERRAVSSPRPRPVRHQGHRRPRAGRWTARRWSRAHYLTRATGIPAVTPARSQEVESCTESGPVEDRYRYLRLDARVDKSETARRLYPSAVGRTRRARDPALRGDRELRPRVNDPHAKTPSDSALQRVLAEDPRDLGGSVRLSNSSSRSSRRADWRWMAS